MTVTTEGLVVSPWSCPWGHWRGLRAHSLSLHGAGDVYRPDGETPNSALTGIKTPSQCRYTTRMNHAGLYDQDSVRKNV